MRFFDKYSGFWRRFKVFYILYNVLNYRHLSRVKSLFKKYGIKRSVFMPFHSEHLKGLQERKEIFNSDEWNEKGFVVLKQLIDDKLIDAINAGMESALESGELAFNYTGRKVVFAYEKVPEIKQVMQHPALLAVLKEKIGGEIVPFQSINFHYGSEQSAHSDSIHMSTYPEGGLIAAWVALEDVTEENGPLFYYPGSHKWPYASNRDIGASTSWMLSPNPNKMYENYISDKIASSDIKAEVYCAKKGDVLIWHANLLHGGMPHQNKNKTRKSLVIHYFKKDVICYHEISQRLAIVKEIV